MNHKSRIMNSDYVSKLSSEEVKTFPESELRELLILAYKGAQVQELADRYQGTANVMLLVKLGAFMQKHLHAILTSLSLRRPWGQATEALEEWNQLMEPNE